MTTKSKLLISTSRRPTKKMRSFSHDLTRCVPSSIHLNRGKLGIYELAEKALENDADRVMILSRWKDHLGKIELYRIGATGLIPFPPLVYVAKIKLQREFGRKKKIGRIKSLTTTLSTKTSPETNKAAESFSDFFKIPLLSVDQAVLNKYRVCMHFSFSSSRHTQITFLLLPSKIEFGPRITVSHLVTELKN